MRKDQYIEMLENKIDVLESQKVSMKMFWVVAWVIIWMIIGGAIYYNDSKKIAEQTAEEQEEEMDIACFWCSTLVNGHCTDDTNWSRWCYSGFEWERPEDEF